MAQDAVSAARFSLEGKRALVTGASRGIGLAIAEALKEVGADVAMAARGADVRVAAATLQAHGFQADISTPEGCADCIEAARHLLGGIDILVNNAGVEDVRPSLDVDEDLWDRILGTNLKGAFFCAQAAARHMQRGSAIINLLSLSSERGIPTAAPYTASKSGLLGITRALAAEWAPLGIRVNGIAPGYFRTALTESFYADAGWQSAMLAKIPLGRFGHLDDLKGAAIFLASDASAYVTGVILPVDGGTLAAL